MVKKSSKKLHPVLRNIEHYCIKHGHQLTKQRKSVLKIIANSKHPVGAYQIIEALSKKTGVPPKPPTIYRAIDFLTKHGFIHRIESLNAFTVFQDGEQHEGAQFLICDGCGSVIETQAHHMPRSAQAYIKEIGFKPKHWSVEIHGMCIICSESEAS